MNNSEEIGHGRTTSRAGLFDTYRCDRTINLGLSLANMSKALKFYEENEGDSIVFTFADPKRDKTQDMTVKKINIDRWHLIIPDQDYAVVCKMSAAEFQKTCKDLSTFSDLLNITNIKAGIVFS